MQAELTRLCSEQVLGVRLAALRAVARHGLKPAAPTLVRMIKAPGFGSLEQTERKELILTLLKLSPDRGEELALEIARKSGVFTSQVREISRIAAIEALAETSRARSAAEAMREIAQTRWGTGEETRARGRLGCRGNRSAHRRAAGGAPMTAHADIMTGDTGESARRARAREMGEEVVVSVHRLAKMAQATETDVQAFGRQLEQAHKSVVMFGLHAGADLRILFADRIVLGRRHPPQRKPRRLRSR